MMASLGINEGASVLDFGCGLGRYTIPLSQAVGKRGHVYAVERSEENFATVRTRLEAFSTTENVTFIKTKTEEIAQIVSNKTIDSIFAFDVLQYIQDLEALFSSFWRVAKPTGVVYIYPAAIPHPGAVAMEHVVATMAKKGFKNMHSSMYKMMHSTDMLDDTVYSFRCNAATEK